MFVSHLPHCMLGYTPPGPEADTPQGPEADTPSGQTPHLGKHPLSRHPQPDTPSQTTLPGRHSPLVQCMLGYSQKAVGTHPTRLHSCLVIK